MTNPAPFPPPIAPVVRAIGDCHASPLQNTENIFDYLLQSHPEERENLRPYLDRAKAYRNDCGCSMGGAFLLGALVLLGFHGFLFQGFERVGWLPEVLWGIAFIFCAGVVGKLIGIGIARIRLALLHRQLRLTYSVKRG